MLRYLLGTEEPDRRTVARALAGLRITAGLLWLFNVNWKRPPDFGRDSRRDLYRYVQDAIDHPVFPPYSWIIQHVVQPAFVPFGWGVLVAETVLAALLLTGTYTRLAALLGIVQSGAIALSVLLTPGEWPWSYYLMIAIHMVLFVGSAGRVWGVDGVRAAAAEGRAGGAAATQLRTWGLVLGAVGVVAGVVADFSSPVTLGAPSFQLSLGAYNVTGGLLLAVVGALMVASARVGRAPLAFAAAAVALIGLGTIWAQTAMRSSVWLGANLTAAALFATAALAAGGCARYLGRTDESTRPDGSGARAHADRAHG